jgi:hypothetical protein
MVQRLNELSPDVMLEDGYFQSFVGNIFAQFLFYLENQDDEEAIYEKGAVWRINAYERLLAHFTVCGSKYD